MFIGFKFERYNTENYLRLLFYMVSCQVKRNVERMSELSTYVE